ncbi:ABC transporter permease [Arthrobacter sp. 35/47]|uniref:ABC transporter permease n=1 Tax=Arthrobacter sp. 35/47 TaxID=269454 RepID=UPI0004B57697|nr:ABC transporter permease [Arthrobacter sp. 35/47]
MPILSTPSPPRPYPAETRRDHSLARAAGKVLARRAAQAVGVTLAVTITCFVIVQNLPGDIAFRIAAGRYGYDKVDASAAAEVRADINLDAPAWQQLGGWILDALRLDFGTSLVTGASVTDELALHLTATLQLAAVALVLSITGGMLIGLLAAQNRGGAVDRLTDAWVSLVRALPPFVLGLVLIIVFSVQLGWVPAAGHGERSNLVLPAITLAVGLSGLFARVTRDAVAQVLESEHVHFARTKGLARHVVLARHVLRNAGVTLVAYIGVQVLILVEGVVVVESLFASPGLGHALVHAVFWRDIPSMQATVLALALIVVVVSTLVDLAVLALDPRTREAQ